MPLMVHAGDACNPFRGNTVLNGAASPKLIWGYPAAPSRPQAPLAHARHSRPPRPSRRPKVAASAGLQSEQWAHFSCWHYPHAQSTGEHGLPSPSHQQAPQKRPDHRCDTALELIVACSWLGSVGSPQWLHQRNTRSGWSQGVPGHLRSLPGAMARTRRSRRRRRPSRRAGRRHWRRACGGRSKVRRQLPGLWMLCQPKPVHEWADPSVHGHAIYALAASCAACTPLPPPLLPRLPPLLPAACRRPWHMLPRTRRLMKPTFRVYRAQGGHLLRGPGSGGVRRCAQDPSTARRAGLLTLPCARLCGRQLAARPSRPRPAARTLPITHPLPFRLRGSASLR